MIFRIALILSWIAVGLLFGPLLSLQLLNTVSPVVVCCIGGVFTALMVASIFTRKLSEATKIGIQGLWLGSALGVTLVYLYFRFVTFSGGYR